MTEPSRNERPVTNAMLLKFLGEKIDRVETTVSQALERQREDHDALTRHGEQITTLFNQDKQLRSELAEVDKTRKVEARIIGVIDGFAAIAAMLASRIKL